MPAFSASASWEIRDPAQSTAKSAALAGSTPPPPKQKLISNLMLIIQEPAPLSRGFRKFSRKFQSFSTRQYFCHVRELPPKVPLSEEKVVQKTTLYPIDNQSALCYNARCRMPDKRFTSPCRIPVPHASLAL